MPAGIPSLAALDHKFLSCDKEWKLHKLPNEEVSVPRDYQPDPENESIPSTKQESPADLERRWNETGLNRIFMGPIASGRNDTA